MRCTIVAGTVLALLVSAPAAWADDEDGSFRGGHGGGSVVAANHHFVVVESFTDGTERSFNVSSWGLGGEAFAGYDLAIGKRLRIGGEAQLEFGGRAARYTDPAYTIGIDPRYGWSVTGRLGYVVAPRSMLYAGIGYGGHRYRGIGAAVGLERNDSFVLRGGVEYRLNRAAGVRLEFQHLDGTRNQFALGIPIRF